MLLLEATFIFFAALLASMFGLGGGILYTPFQLWIGVDFHLAVITSLFLVFFTSLSSTIVYRKNNRVDWVLGIIIEIPTVTGAYTGGVLSYYIPVIYLRWLLVVLIFLAAYLMVRPARETSHTLCSGGESGKRKIFWWNRKLGGERYSLNLLCVLIIMFIVGNIISMVGISGGVLKVPIMAEIFGVPLPVAIGSSAFMVGLTSLGGLLGHITFTKVNWGILFLLLIPVILGAQIGSRISIKMEREKLKKVYALFLIVVGVITLVL